RQLLSTEPTATVSLTLHQSPNAVVSQSLLTLRPLHSSLTSQLSKLSLVWKPTPSRTPVANVRLQPCKAETFDIGSGDGQITVGLPYGMPQFVNARTLKAICGVNRADVLFRKIGDRWEICPDSLRVDLADRTQMFRIGKLQIYS